MNDILENIAANKRKEVEAAKRVISESAMFAMARQSRRQPLSLKGAIGGNYSGIIAEFKRRSPSKGNIHPCAEVAPVVSGYAANGAAACSILTDTRFFGGSLADFDIARATVHIPLLRKEFMVDSYQVAEAYLHGADAVLLIASLLTAQEIEALQVVAHDFGMETIVEIHNEREISKIPADADIVGVNNRNLRTFNTDIDASYNMMRLLPEGVMKIAESGIVSHNDLLRLRSIGYDGFLIGETFMKKDDPGEALKAFINPPKLTNDDIHPNMR